MPQAQHPQITGKKLDRDTQRGRIRNFKIGPPEGKSRGSVTRFYANSGKREKYLRDRNRGRQDAGQRAVLALRETIDNIHWAGFGDPAAISA
jgi:hypothetical protein